MGIDSLSCKVEDLKIDNIDNLNLDIKNEIQNLDEYSLAKKIEGLNECNSKKTWELYFEIAFENLFFMGKDLEEKYNNFCNRYDIVNTSTHERIVFDKEKGIENFIIIKKIIIEKLVEFFESKKEEVLKEVDKLRDIRVKNRSYTYAYFVYFENAQEDPYLDEKNKKISELNQKLESGEISGKEYLELLENIVSEIYGRLREKLSQKAEVLEIFEREPTFFSPDLGSVFKKAIDKGLRFRKVGDELYSYTQDGIFIEKVKFPISDSDKYFQTLISKYSNLKLKDYINLEIDQEEDITRSYVSNTELVDEIEIPKLYAKKLKEYQDKGYKFKIVSLIGNSFEMLVLKDDYVIFSINNSGNNDNNQFDLWLDILLKNLKEIEKLESKEKISLPKEDIKTLERNKINFVNEVYDLIFDGKGKIKENSVFTDFSIDNLVKIGLKHNLSLKTIFSQIPLIYDVLSNKGVNVYRFIIQNIHNFVPNNQSYLQNFNIPEKEYQKTSNSFRKMHFLIWQKAILERPGIALDEIIDLCDHYMSREVNFTENIQRDIDGINTIIIAALRKVISANPDFYESEKMQELFKKYPGLEKIISNGIGQKMENKKVLGAMSGGSQEDFESSVGNELISKIKIRIKNEWIEEFIKDDKEVGEIKLAVARNLYIQYSGNIDKLYIDLNDNGEKIVRENLRLMLEKIRGIKDVQFFGSNDIYHIAHFGQDMGFDAMGTKPTRDAIQYQKGDKSYNFFDGEDIFAGKGSAGKMKLENYYNDFIRNKGPAMIITEGHGNNETFSVLNKYKESDKLGINRLGNEGIDLSYKKLADIIIKRQKYKDENGITSPDTILFAACKGDYAINFYNELDNRSNELGPNFIPPIMMTAAEAGQNSIFNGSNLDTEIPYQIFKYVLDIGSKEKTTFGTFFKNQHREEMGSNPCLFYPIKINGKWFPQQLG